MNLPTLVKIEQMAGVDSAEKWKNYVEVIYEIFCAEVANARLAYQGLPIKCRYHEPYDGKHFSFWHMISNGFVEEDRTPDFERCARIRWISFLICHADDPNFVRVWEQERKTKHGRKKRVVLWLYNHDYVVILEPKATCYFIITTYCISGGTRRKFTKEWEDWEAKKAEAAD